MDRRIGRGMFKTSNGRIIHADINGGYKIFVNGFPNIFADGIEDVLNG